MHVLLGADRHGRNEIRRKFGFVLNHVRRGRIDRILIGLIHIHSERLRGEGVNVRARAESVLSHVRP